MEKNVRRARMFIMADRIQRFIGAFTVGFVVLAVTFAGSFVGLVLPAAVAAGAFFFFLGTMAYGIVRRKKKNAPAATAVGSASPTKLDRKSTRLNSSHPVISYAVFFFK